ncbi:hypothetical protein M501DRAFT_994432 [Patellaria atrata CBS 101060]|uniref:Uncharacterized protein n=1 Tax=Patellaria atrata CBS 101060 TaxID=1346257 RepID=A0A9P4VVX0_9PEZI|nr:hypothetical protein M501DRAFT_994432 [Patellaria atrata CBS 101060]
MDLRDSVDEMIQEARWIDAHRSQLNNTQPENYNLFSELIMTGFTDARLLRQNSINSGPVPIFALEYALSSGRRYLGRTSRYIPPSLRGVERMLRYYREYHTIRHSSLDQHKDRRSRIEALFTDRARDIDIRIGQIDHIRDEYRLGRIRYAEFKAAHVERGILREELRCIDRLKRRSIGSFVRSAINLVSNILPSSLNSAAS